MKIMIDSGNTVGDMVSEEFTQRMGLDGDKVQDHIAVPTAATATTVRVVKRGQEITAKLEGIEGDFIMRLLVVRGLMHPVNLGQHFLGRHWCSLDFAAGYTQLGVWGQSVQLVGRQTGRAQRTGEGGRPGGSGGLPPPTNGGPKKPGPAAEKRTAAPTGAGAAAQGPPTGKKPRRPSSLRDEDEDEVQVVKVQQGSMTLPTRVKERRYK